MHGLYKIHRFFASQSFYPIFLSSLLTVSFFAGRLLLSGTWAYRFLPWNLFLAWIPYLSSVLAAGLHRLFPRQPWLLLLPGVVWLIFFPNAPYLLTDFQHLNERPPIPLWYDIGLLAAFAWTGLFLALASLRTMHLLVKRYLGWLVSWMFVLAAIGMSALGIYLGRFLRWNSWDLLVQPFNILEDVLIRLSSPLSNLRFVGFTLMFTAFLLVCYLTFTSVQSIREHRD